ncbi:non-ribosomal peptide synthetase [Anaerocolumna xylanovorans]|uniref:Amino acid adenylation domain-containing protein n=1 Tax=Anaerocolumna xylanovorans DSM 12503 TaxID=1121345 RepID=A0A1M7YI92_9FIRM|nr:non-ribosomal peptide synthetase [Anaerocolumna xylanovorans]SHO52357.1 amino acid adenylation domain-containing protein [Anaerocolumna xylanovorans DSM 12503]
MNNIDKMYYLTPMQEGMLFHVLKGTYCNAYFGQGIFKLNGTIEAEAFREALNLTSKECDAFRTKIVYKKMKKAVQLVVKENTLDFVFADLTNEENATDSLKEYILRDRERGMVLEKDNLVRFQLFKTAEDTYEFIFSFHHIIMDGWCVGILAEDIFRTYNSLISKQAVELKHNAYYMNYVKWLENQDKMKSDRYWEKYLDGIENVTDIPPDLDIDNQQYSRKEYRFSLDSEIYQGILKTAQKIGITTNIIVSTVWGILLQKYNYTDDVVFGTVVSGRNAKVKDIDKMIGLFINTLPFRVQTKAEEKFSDLLKRLQQNYLHSSEFEYASLNRIQKVCQLGDKTISHLIAFQNFPLGNMQSIESKNSISITDWEVYQQTNYDFCMEIMQKETLEYYIVYNGNKYSEHFIKKIEKQLTYLFQQVIGREDIRIKDIQITDKKITDKILTVFNEELDSSCLVKSIPDIFKEQVSLYPNKKIVFQKTKALSYQELDEKSERLMKVLLCKAVKKGELVGVFANDSIEMVIGMLGILKAGGAYLPIEPSYPTGRIHDMLEEAETRIVLMTSDMPNVFESGLEIVYLDKEDRWKAEETVLQPEICGDDLAYVMFTSGTTNKPKGVMIKQKSIIRLVKNTNYIQINEKDKILKTGSIVFDASTFEIWGALLCGAELYFVPKETVLNPRELKHELVDKKITILWLTTALFNQFVENDITMFSNLKKLLTGGDIASATHFNKVKECYPKLDLINGYGPTENTTFTACYSAGEAKKGNVSIGKPVTNSTVYILDVYGNLLDSGMLGEIYTGGYGVAAGYFKDKELTKQKFQPDPFIKNGIMYRTGDLAYWEENGNIGFMGRLDKQIKIRGFRVSLSEIEDCILNMNKEIETAAVVVHDYENGNKKLFAFIVSRQTIDVEKMKEAMSEILPHYMVPSCIIQIERIPVTLNGKADRKKLMSYIPEVTAGNYEKPQSNMEVVLTDVWQEALTIREIGINDNFFDIGGDSIIAMTLTSYANKKNIAISVSDLYAYPTIKKLAAYVENMDANQDNKIMEMDRINTYEPDLENRYKEFPLNDIQMAYLIGRNKQFELGGFSTHFYAEFETGMDMSKLNKSLNCVIKRHPMMRAIVMESGNQRILEDVPEYKMVIEDMTTVSEDFKNRRLMSERSRMEKYVFPLEQWPLFELKAFKLGDNKYQLSFGIDILIIDGASLFILMKELMKYYNSSEQQDEEIEFTFRDYTLALKDFKTKEVYQKHKDYWMNKLEDFPFPPALNLKIDTNTLDTVEFQRKQFVLQKRRWNMVKEAAKKHNVTVAGLLCTIYSKILSFWSGNSRLAINTTVFSRYPFHEEVKKLVGDFTCILLLDIDLSNSKDFWDQVENVQKVLAEALEHRHYSGVEFTREIAKYRNQVSQAVMPYVFTCALYEDAASLYKDMVQVKYARSQTPQVYLDNQIIETDGELQVVWDYPAGIFDQDMIDEMFREYVDIIDSIADDTVREITLSQKNLELLARYNDTYEKIEPATLQGMFKSSADEYPDFPAVSCGDKEYTYKELEERSNKMANCLSKKNVAAGDHVSIIVERCIETIVNLLAVLKIGAAYVPINPEYPAERQKYISDDSNSVLCLKKESYQEYGADMCEASFTHDTDVNRVAYIIYTSGSTGKPKGVVIEHKAVSNTIFDINNKFQVTSTDKIIGLSSMCFDLSVYDIFGAFSTGAELVMVKDQRNVKEILNVMKSKKITFWNSVPSIMEMLLNHLEDDFKDTNLKNILMSGDWIPLNIIDKIRKYFIQADICSLGGATEASIWSIYYPIHEVQASWSSIPYGKPLANQKIYVLNDEGNACQIGVIGEIYIGGTGVAKEYANDKLKTDMTFIWHQEYGRIYKTGDYGRMCPEGCVEFMGRRDSQVKIRGYRVEYGEIESALNECEGVSNSIADLYQAENGGKQLIGYVVLDTGIDKAYIPDENDRFIYDNTQNASEKYQGEVSLGSLKKLNAVIEQISTAYILNALIELKINELTKENLSFEEIDEKVQILPEYYKLFHSWLDIAAEDAYLKYENGGIRLLKEITPYDIKKLWDDLYEMEPSEDLQTPLEYLKLSGMNHVNMMRGKVNPLTLFFPKGSFNTAESLYKFSPIAKYMNSIVVETVKSIVTSHKGEKKLRVLEVGAGTGGTTDEILPVFRPECTEYTFTDLSDFFLEQAEKRYENYPFIKYGLLDINVDAQIQGYDFAAYDLIICANVIHDAENIQDALERLKILLADDGRLLIVEGTRNSRQQLASVRFIEGLSQFQDERIENNQPLLSVEKWRNQFNKAGFVNFDAFPKKEELSGVFGNHVMIGKKHVEGPSVTTDKLKKYLCQRIPDYMVPAKFIQIKEIPLSGNGKVNKKKLIKPVTVKNKSSAYIRPTTDNQEKLVKVWQEVLGMEQIGIKDDFFDLGGDSLKAVEIVSKAENEGISISLTEMYSNPTIEELTKRISEKGTSKNTDNIGNMMLIKEGTDQEKDIFFVHAGSGEVGVYVELCKYIDSSYYCWAFNAIKSESIAPQNVTVEELAEKYIEKMLKVRPHGPYEIGGWCVGGTIAFEIARQLEARGEKVSHLILINSNAPSRIRKEKVMAFETGSEIRLLKQMISLPVKQLSEISSLDDIWSVITEYAKKGNMDINLMKQMVPSTILRVIPEKNSEDARSFVMYLNRIRSFVNARDSFIPETSVKARGLFIGAEQEMIEDRLEWSKYIEEKIQYEEVPGDHVSIFESKNVVGLAEKINEFLN